MNRLSSLSSHSHGLRGNAYPTPLRQHHIPTQKPGIERKRTTFASIALLWFCVALAGSVAAQEQARKKEYVGEMTCRLCHNKSAFGTQWDIWRNSPHARAYKTLFTEQSREIARKLELGPAPHEASECLRCHVTAYDRQTKTVPKNIRRENGVQCESCHGQGSRHVPDGRRYWMEGDRTVDTAANIVRPNDRACAQCHRRNSPTWDPKRYSLPGGRTTGFDFQQAFAKIAHPLLKHFDDDDDPTEKEDLD